jgi:hypothetical protein
MLVLLLVPRARARPPVLVLIGLNALLDELSPKRERRIVRAERFQARRHSAVGCAELVERVEQTMNVEAVGDALLLCPTVRQGQHLHRDELARDRHLGSLEGFKRGKRRHLTHVYQVAVLGFA